MMVQGSTIQHQRRTHIDVLGTVRGCGPVANNGGSARQVSLTHGIKTLSTARHVRRSWVRGANRCKERGFNALPDQHEGEIFLL